MALLSAGGFGTYCPWATDYRRKGTAMKKFLILLGIIGLVIAVAMYVRNRQGELEY
jgi:hypothetical protein